MTQKPFPFPYPNTLMLDVNVMPKAAGLRCSQTLEAKRGDLYGQ